MAGGIEAPIWNEVHRSAGRSGGGQPGARQSDDRSSLEMGLLHRRSFRELQYRYGCSIRASFITCYDLTLF
jgi:hypothetical protein